MNILWLLILCVTVGSYISAQEHGFISIDCGSQEVYTDARTGIRWVTDQEFIQTGYDRQLLNPAFLETKTSYFPQPLRSLRYFPTNGSRKKNCYVLPVKENDLYLIRAGFQQLNEAKISHGSSSRNKEDEYTDKGNVQFNISVDSTLWLTVNVVSSHLTSHEAIFTPQGDEVYFCLIDIGKGDPFVSSLELRPLQGTSYAEVAKGSFLSLLSRVNFAGQGDTRWLRYPDDRFDRIWHQQNDKDTSYKRLEYQKAKSMQFPVISDPPAAVMQSAWFNERAISFQIGDFVSKRLVLDTRDTNRFISVLHRWNLHSEKLECQQFSSSQVYFNNEELLGASNVTYWDIRTMSSLETFIESKWEILSAAFGIFLNAVEFYAMYPSVSLTDKRDVTAISIIRQSLNLSSVSTGDPCLPIPWHWIVCDSNDPPRITQLLLNNTDYNGVVPDFTGLEKLEILYPNTKDLSGNLSLVFSRSRKLRQLRDQSKHENDIQEGEKLQDTRSSETRSDTSVDDNLQNPLPLRKRPAWIRVLNSSPFLGVAAALSFTVLTGIIAFIFVQSRKDLCSTQDNDMEGNSTQTVVVAETTGSVASPAASGHNGPRAHQISGDTENAENFASPAATAHSEPRADQISRDMENTTSRTDLISRGGVRSDEE
ncbi:hypothetical protein R1flu_020648 [Riccia fluitans]|uniref:Malectin-like domain-containing protein n=1 Tax=Riccia fluitans TaxID=41844 RepID=A0ABD1ZNL6_9MARC